MRLVGGHVRGRAVEGVLNRLGKTSRRASEPRSMDIDDSDIGTGASAWCVMISSMVVSCVAASGKELGGDEGRLIGRAGGGWWATRRGQQRGLDRDWMA